MPRYPRDGKRPALPWAPAPAVPASFTAAAQTDQVDGAPGAERAAGEVSSPPGLTPEKPGHCFGLDIADALAERLA